MQDKRRVTCLCCKPFYTPWPEIVSQAEYEIAYKNFSFTPGIKGLEVKTQPFRELQLSTYLPYKTKFPFQG